MVVHQPGDWFDETLDALAAQDYGNLRSLFLLTSADDDEIAALGAQIRAVLPKAFVRPLAANVGFGPAVNEVLRLVEGDNGFLLVCHDDIAPAGNAVRLMVAELFRSNAGVVGPKLTDWDQPRTLQHVGLGLDRFGEVDPLVEPGEVDQEQHDAVRDVFVLPSACLLIRADLFRALGGFDPAISFHGEDVDLCWRAHMTGARVIVVPDARVRHRERLDQRRPELNHQVFRSRHRMRTVATLTGGSRLLGRSIQLVALTLVEVVVGLFTGRLSEAFSSLRALIGLIPRTRSILARRRAIRGQRVVPEREILGLQDLGSSRLTSFLRGKETATYVSEGSTVRRWREASFGPFLAWCAVLLAIAIGSRSFIRDGVPTVGEFLRYPSSPADLLAQFRSGFDTRGFGQTGSNPTGWAILAVASVFALFRMSLFMTMTVIGMFVAGAVGAWRLATVFPTNRARVAGTVVYVGTPLVPGLLGHGSWSGLAWYAALPWLVHLLRRSAGLATADPAAAETGLTDGVGPVSQRERARCLAYLSLVVAVVAAFVPATVVLWATVGALLSIATLFAGGSWRVAAWLAGSTMVSVAVGLLLNLPWAFEWTWGDVVGPSLAGSTGRRLEDVATLAPNSERFAILALALYLPVLAAIAITRAWRLTWSVRAGMLVFGFGSVLVLSERGSLGFAVPNAALLSSPIALGLALGSAAIADGFGADVLARGFGWRQPVALVANLAIVVGLIPGVVSIGDGGWHAPRTTIVHLLESQLPVDPIGGDYRVLYVGDPRVLPIPGRAYVDGVAFSVADSGAFDFADRFVAPETGGDDAVKRSLDLIANGATLRAGRILAPLGIRYVVIPKTDGVSSTVDDPIVEPLGLVAAFQNQLDLGSTYGPPSLEIFVNFAWIPVGAQLTGATAEASKLAGEAALVGADLSDAVPSMVGFDAAGVGTNEVAPGVVHLAVPFDDRFTLQIADTIVEPRPGFGVTTAFDVERSGTGVIRYERDTRRSLWLAAQAALWLVALIVAAGARSPFGIRRTTVIHDETLIDLGDDPSISGPGVAGEVLGLLTWADEQDEQDEQDDGGLRPDDAASTTSVAEANRDIQADVEIADPDVEDRS